MLQKSIKFKILKEIGYDGVELNSPGGVNKDEALSASRETEFPIHGVVDSIHWGTRLSSPDEATRAKGLQGLKTALRDTSKVGGSAVLLVPGAVRDAKNENHDHSKHDHSDKEDSPKSKKTAKSLKKRIIN